MASFKLNVARIKGCPPAKQVLEAIEAYGLPETEEFGVLTCSGTDTSIFATIVRKTHQAVQNVDPETRELTSSAVQRVTVYPFGCRPDTETLEIYAGSATGIEQLGVFFSSCLALPTVVEGVELDLPAALERLAKETQRFVLKSIRVSDYAHNAYMAGPYAPKFLDSEHGKDFMSEYLDHITTASVRFQGPSGRVNVTLTPRACFSYSCNEDDQAAVQSILRKLL